MIRRLVLAGCLAALAVPTGASAMLPDGRPQQPQQQQQQQYSLPSGWHSEVQTQAPQRSVQTFALHKGFRPEVQTQSPATPAAPSPSIVRQIETVSDDSGRTLAIVLASIAMAIALGSLAYATIRMTRFERRELESH